MTKDQLNFAQYLLGVSERGRYFLTIPGIKAHDSNQKDVEHAILQLTGAAEEIFLELTGRLAHRVSIWELNNTSPASWTKLAGKAGYPNTGEDVAERIVTDHPEGDTTSSED